METLGDKIDAILPQTQCRLCEYNGCRPYANAIANDGESIDKCLPGGTKVLEKIANLTKQDAKPLMASMEQKAKPAMLAVIREDECIGCTKCIQHCPVDAIAGTAKQMHVIITDECTGCELCIAPCPVDCIDMITINGPSSESEKQNNADHARMRFENRNERLARNEKRLAEKRQKRANKIEALPDKAKIDKQALIQAAIKRVQAKRTTDTENSDERR